jgi:PPOX class probable F420-dependent enzyme
MNQSEALTRLETARVGRFATITAGGRPHIVPITFAMVEGRIVHMVDHKPKRSVELKRLANLRTDSHASLLVDHYQEDWARLWWIRVDGQAVVSDQGPEWESARQALTRKYPQYQTRPPEGPAVLMTIRNITSWAASE